MLSFLDGLSGTTFLPHGQCYLWAPSLVWLHAVSDALIAVAYLSIPASLLYFVWRRRDVPFPALFILFSLFIVSCGLTHLFGVWTIWQPDYWVSGGMKAFTAMISLASAGVTIRLLPLALRLPNRDELTKLTTELDERVRARTAELVAANERLTAEIRQRESAESEVRRLNASLEQRLVELQTLFNLMPVGVGIAHDPECREIRMNPALADMLGLDPHANASLSAEDSPARSRFKVLHQGRELASDELPMQRATRENTAITDFEETVLRDDGGKVDLIANAVPLRDATGRARGCVAVFQDITQRKRDEDSRLEFERRLRDTQKLESLGVLAGGIAHDFNNLLTGVLGHASLARLELGPGQEGIAESLGQIEKSSLRAGDLCKQLLAYAGKGRFHVQPLNLSRLVEEIAHLMEVSISKKAELRLQLAPSAPTFTGDATQIRQVLMNLVINASEAMPADRGGRGLITVATSRAHVTSDYLQRLSFTETLPEGDYVVLEVTDNGTGMTPETQTRLFDPFFTTKFTGRGLGLAAVLGIIRGHNGTIKVYSELGRGTTFKILLPALPQDTPTPGDEVQPAAAWRGSGTALVVDDEDSVRLVAAHLLKKLGFQVVTARDGQEALQIVRGGAHDFTVILLDLTMPHLDGEETLRSLRASNNRVPVLLMSGFNEQDTINRFVGRGMAGFLPKPFSFEMVAKRLEEILGRPPPAPPQT